MKKLTQGHWPIFILSSFSSIGNLFLPLVLVRLLTTDEVGIYKIFFLHLQAIPFLVLAGGPIHSVYYWAGKGENEKKSYLDATWTLTLLLSSLALILGFPLRSVLAERLTLPVQYVDYMLIAGFLSCPSGHYVESTIAEGKTLRGSLFSTIGEVFKALCFILIAWKTKDIHWLIIFYVIFLALKTTLGSYWNTTQNNIHLSTDKLKIKEVFSYCFPIAFTGLLGFFIDKIDLLILSGKLDTTSFAYYSMGCLIVPPLYMLEMSVQKTLLPMISKSFNQKNTSEGSQYFRKSISDIAYLIVPAIFGLIVFARPIVAILYTEKFMESVPFLQIFAVTYLLLCFPHDSVPRATGKSGWILKVYCLVTPISLVAVYLSTTYLTTTLVLSVSVLMKFIPKIWGLSYSRKIMNWSWKEMFPLQKLTLYFGLAIALSIGSILLKPLFMQEKIWFLVCGGMFAVIYLSVANILGKRIIP